MRFSLILLFSFFFSASAQAKLTACTITINSSDEREVLKSSLNPNDFDFVELTDFGDASESSTGWFDNACKAKVQCDVLAVSGHFGGNFFGFLTEFRWRANTMEQNSCQNTCDGVMKRPKEIYLFGCNTLASKDKDDRSPERYLQILLNDHVDHAEAERIVAARYGPWGTSFKDFMARIFEGVPAIYGFNSVGPSGPNVRKYLKSYLNKVGDFKKHLEASDFERSQKLWMSEMKETNRTVAFGVLQSNPAYSIRTNLCTLHDDTKTYEDRLRKSADLLSEDFEIYLPTVSNFINDKIEYYFDPPNKGYEGLRSILDDLKKRRDLESKFRGIENDPKVSPSLRIDILRASRTIGWLSPEEFSDEMHKTILPFLKNPKTEDADFICSQMKANKMKQYMPRDLLLQFPYNTLAQIRIAGCYNRFDKELGKRAFEGYVHDLKSFSAVERAAAMISLDRFETNHKEKRQYVEPIIQSGSSPQVKMWAFYRMVKYTEGEEQIRWMQKVLDKTSPQNLGWISEALAENPVKNLAATQMLLSRMFSQPPKGFQMFRMPYGLVFSSSALEDWLAVQLQSSDAMYTITSAFAYELVGKVQSSKLSQQILDVFKSRMERKENDFSGYLCGALALSSLTKEQLEQIQVIYRTLPQDEYIAAYLRDILYNQGRRLIRVDTSVLTGKKLRHQCKMIQTEFEQTLNCNGTNEYY